MSGWLANTDWTERLGKAALVAAESVVALETQHVSSTEHDAQPGHEAHGKVHRRLIGSNAAWVLMSRGVTVLPVVGRLLDQAGLDA